jgi:DNA-binding NtrC family response regulator
MLKYKILIVDDDKLLQNSLKNILGEKYDVSIAGSGEEAVEQQKKNPADLVLLDIRLPGICGIDALREMLKTDKDLLVIMMTAYEDISTVIKSMKMGAYDYFVKPLDIDELDIIIEKATNTLRLKKEVEELRKQYRCEFGIDNIIGESEGIRKALEIARRISKSPDTTVLIEGETGTGKEIIARAIHYHSSRIGRPFIGINCGAINRDLIESELFGYEKGTFTGGLQTGKKGKVELAEGGSLFLDEVSELIPAVQVKLLRFLEEREFYALGGTETRKVDVRVIAATNRKLEDLVEQNLFREDLYYRLNVVKIELPPLRERREDILPLCLFFMDRFSVKCGRNVQGISPEAKDLLVRYDWPGNVRELRNAMERVMLMEDDHLIRAEHLYFLKKEHPPAVKGDSSDFRIPPTGIDLDGLIRDLMIQALDLSGGNKSKAAQLLGISRPTMVYRIEKFGLKV